MRKLKLMAATSAVALLAAGSAYAADPVEKEGMNLVVYGHINYVAMYAENEQTGEFFVANNTVSTSRFGLKSTGAINDDLSVGAHIEAHWSGSNSNAATFDNPTAGTNGIGMRLAYLWVKSASMGKVSLGHANTAANGYMEVDLSGTGMTALGLGSSQLVGTAVAGLNTGSNFAAFDGDSRQDAIRYDTPSIAGFTLSTSATTDGTHDVALRFARAFGEFKVAAAAAYIDWSDSNDARDDEVGGSIAIKHASGLNLGLYYAEQETDAGVETESWLIKPGYTASLNEYGPTSFAVDYGESDIDGAGTAEIYGAFIAQSISHLGATFYAGYRHFESTTGDDADVVWVGSRVKF